MRSYAGRTTRRRFLQAAGLAATALTGGRSGLASRRFRQSDPARQARVVDVHAHCAVPVTDVVTGTEFERFGAAAPRDQIGRDRLRRMDAAGIDVQVLSINGFWWYGAERALAGRIVERQNRGLAEIARTYPGRFAGFASVALQFPDLAARQLESAVQQLGLRGAAIAGHVNGEDLSLQRYDPFWAAAAALRVPVFMHPGGAVNLVRPDVFAGRGDLGNIIGNPLETTYFLSRLIFDGTLDRHSDLRIIAAHGGGFLPSYLARTDVACEVRADANCANRRRPREYFRDQILVDSMVFTDEGLRHLVTEVGSAQVVYGTDMPFNWPDTLEVIGSASYLSASEKRSIRGGRLETLLRLQG